MRFSTERAANDHMRAKQHYYYPYSCETCDLAFRFAYVRDNHQNAEGHYKHLHCSDCDRYFKNANNLDQHMKSRIHQGSSVCCPFCKASFVTASGVSHHLETSSCPKAKNLSSSVIHRALRQRDPNGVITEPLPTMAVAMSATSATASSAPPEALISISAAQSTKPLSTTAPTRPASVAANAYLRSRRSSTTLRVRVVALSSPGTIKLVPLTTPLLLYSSVSTFRNWTKLNSLNSNSNQVMSSRKGSLDHGRAPSEDRPPSKKALGPNKNGHDVLDGSVKTTISQPSRCLHNFQIRIFYCLRFPLT
ncbi:hypothetical protein KCU81_g163, partial [Aureobasidium melanogenum]